ncbi:MAG: glycosyltransferase family 1 protein [Nitrospirae bacterium]|nr:MAG: glycosyltransferase family 1 protein [Nitrospirota bacterium]
MAQVRLLELRNTYKWGGGPDKTILLSAERHDPARVSVVVAYIRDVRDREFQISEMARARGLTYYEIPERSKFDVRALRAIRDLIIQHDINLIHGHDYKSDLFAFLVQKWLWRRQLAVVATAHAWVMLGLRGELYRRMDLWLMRRFSHVIAVSNATKEEMLAAGIPSSKITVIHNGIDTDVWSRARVTTTLRDELQISATTPVVGYVGRLMPEKDLGTWLQAAAIVAKHYPQIQFVLVGEGRDETTLRELQDLAHRLGIADRVLFPGYRRQLLSAYAAFDLFVLSSLREGLPNSILEAMALGVPVVTTDVAGAKELVKHGETGLVVPQQDPERLAHAILAVMGDAALRERMAQASRSRIETHFSFANRLKRVEELYERVLGFTHGVSTRPAVAY